ncbi:MAG: Lpg1974 family pore-forming outer membrane protein [Simkaniaceae bacterium]|nr:Lpg1974 family pore-forming outer membrane protein [Candidatus Sacchlamyda saccharinae]
MKKTLLALSLAAAGQLAADCNDCCEPCCVPQPKKCIDCECYTPKYYDLQCACDFFGTVDFLYWYGKETGLSYALRGEIVPTQGNATDLIPSVSASREVKWMEESWDPGVRVGIGANDVFCDGWELYFYWTYYHTNKNQKTSIEGFDKFLINPWGADTNAQALINVSILENIPAGSSNTNEIKAKWELDYNTFDLELGRNYWLSRCFSMRPYMGIRGGWTKTRFKTAEDQAFLSPLDETDVFLSSSANFKNRFWGVGLSGGFQPNWHLGCGFSIFGNADIALLWGCFDLVRDGFFTALSIDSSGGTETISDTILDYGKSKSKFSAMQAVLDLGAGLRYECTFCCDSYRFALDLAWEHHIWFDHNHRNQLDTSLVALGENESFAFALDNFREIYGNLALAGLVVRARFDF